MTRQERIAELKEWAKPQSVDGIEKRLFHEAKMRWQVSNLTAQDYARTIVQVLKSE